ncbi:MAG TPA: hypothetical protein VLC74_03255 [Rhizomicrobium sp.]|nr:hypothetical protein [Rhizomicrobium sp.]
MLSEMGINCLVTFNFGYRVGIETATHAIQKFCNMLDHKALGKKWNTKTESERTKLFAFGEHMRSNAHWHGPGEIPEDTLRVMIRHGDDFWKKVAPRGQLALECPPKSVRAIINYATKRLLEVDAMDRVVPYWPKRNK